MPVCRDAVIQSHEVQTVAVVERAGSGQLYRTATPHRALTGGIHQHVAHHSRHHGEELPASLPIDIADRLQPQINLMDQRRRLQRAAALFRMQIACGHAVHFFIEFRVDGIDCRLIPGSPLLEKCGDIRHLSLAASLAWQILLESKPGKRQVKGFTPPDRSINDAASTAAGGIRR